MKRQLINGFAFALCFASVTAFGADTRLLNTSEVLVADPRYDVAPYTRTRATIASNGEGYLLAWIDGREPTPSVRAARIDGNGEVLDPLSIVVSRDVTEAPAHNLTLAVASDGVDYLLAYDCGTVDTPAICTSLVSQEGVLQRSVTRYPGTTPDLAWNGSRYLLGYRRSNLLRPAAERSLYAQFLTRTGDPVGKEILLGIGNGASVALASDGTDFYAAWTFDRVLGRVIRLDGSIGPAQPLSDPTGSNRGRSIDIAFNGLGEYLVLWVQATPSEQGITARRVSAAGSPLQEPVVILDKSTSSMPEPSVTRVGNRYLITFRVFTFPVAETRVIYANDILELSEPHTVSTDKFFSEQPTIASNGHRTNLAFVEANQVRVLDLESSTKKTVSFSAGAQERPSVSSSSDHDLVAWLEVAGEEQRRALYTKRAFDNGPGFLVSDSEFDQANPAISGGTSPMVFWMEPLRRGELRGTIRGKRVTPAGEPQSGDPTLLAETLLPFSFAVTTIGKTHYVIWIAVNGQLMMTRVMDDGSLIDIVPIPIMTASSDLASGTPSVSTDGLHLFIAWNSVGQNSCPFSCPPLRSLNVARVTPEGVVASSSRPVDQTGGPSTVLWTGREYSVFWINHDIETRAPNGLAALRFDRRGRRLDAQPIMIDSKARSGRPEIVWNGREFVEALLTDSRFSALSELLVNRIDRKLGVMETIIVPPAGRQSPVPAVFRGRDYIIYTKTILDHPYLGVPRIVIRSLDQLPRTRALRR